MRIDVVSIFPEYLAPLELSLIGKARQDGLLDLHVHDLRAFTTDRHRTVDDTPYGGGAAGRCRQAGPDRPVACGGALHAGPRLRTGRRGAPRICLRTVRGHRRT